MMKQTHILLIVDGQGGGVGSQLVKLLRPNLPEDWQLLCAGTNVMAVSAMLKAGAAQGASGENAVIYNASRADLILGPIGIAVSGSQAHKILIPASSCGVVVAGNTGCKLEETLRQAAALAVSYMTGN